MIGERREEFVQQIAMRGMDLDRLDPKPRCPPGGVGEGIANPRQARLVQATGA